MGAGTMARPTLRLRSLTKTADEPAEWEGVTEFGEVFFAQVEAGRLRWGFGRTIDVARDVALGAPVRRCGGDRDHGLATERMLELLRLGVRP